MKEIASRFAKSFLSSLSFVLTVLGALVLAHLFTHPERVNAKAEKFLVFETAEEGTEEAAPEGTEDIRKVFIEDLNIWCLTSVKHPGILVCPLGPQPKPQPAKKGTIEL